MAADPSQGATAQEFAAAFEAMGAGFDGYARAVLARVGRVLVERTKGSLSDAFALMDRAGAGAIARGPFAELVREHGDQNLSDAQQDRLWEVACTVGGHSGGQLDFAAFSNVFAQAGDFSAPAARRDVPTLEESCQHLHRLGRAAALRSALLSRGPEGFLPRARLADAVREAAPELLGIEADQVCRLAEQKGGPMGGEDEYDFRPLLRRFEGPGGDWHVIEPAERGAVADVCRYVDASLQTWGYRSLSQLMASAVDGSSGSVPAHELLRCLSRFLQRGEDRRVAEVSVLRLGRRVDGDGDRVDLAEFCSRFEELARGPGAPGGQGAAGGAPYQSGRACQREGDPPVDCYALGAVRQSQLAARLGREFPAGAVPFDRLTPVLLTEIQPLPTTRQLTRLKKWMQPDCYWPMLTAFTFTVGKIAVKASKEVRREFPQMQLRVSFCGETVAFKKVPWRAGFGFNPTMLCYSGSPLEVELQVRWHAMFFLDGPQALKQDDIARALSQDPKPPNSHRIKVALYGLKIVTDRRGTASEEAHELGAFYLGVSDDIPATDVRLGDAERRIEYPPPGDDAAHRVQPTLSASIAFSTHRAWRLREAIGAGVGAA